MFAVYKQGDGKFKIQYPNERGDKTLTVTGLTIEQVHEAMNHHYDAGPRAMQHAANAIDHCPLCRAQDVVGKPLGGVRLFVQ